MAVRLLLKFFVLLLVLQFEVAIGFWNLVQHFLVFGISKQFAMLIQQLEARWPLGMKVNTPSVATGFLVILGASSKKHP
jgi:uncharacterized membrane protein YoaK (UPF0700 family)